MLEELRNLQAALVMFTRLPLASPALQERHFQQAPCYLPIAGAIVAAISIVIYLGFNHFLSAQTAALAALISAIIVTGAIHEDGFADCCDGFAAVPSQSRSEESIEKILTIMKDSRLGSFATLGLIALFLSRWQLFGEISHEQHIIALLSLYSLSKLAPLIIMWKMHYVNSANIDSKMTNKVALNPYKTLIITLFLLALLSLVTPIPLLAMELLTLALLTTALTYYFNKRLGGYNGDCLGASEQICGLLLLLVFAFYF